MTPALSFVIATRSGWGAIERTVRCLADQTVAERIELVVVAIGSGATVEDGTADGPGREQPAGGPPDAVARLASWRVVSAPHARSVAEANAAGARAARAGVVAFGEDHAFPLPTWAEALLARHGEPWAVVGPVVRNANPRTVASRADFALGYGAYAEGVAAGEAETAPGHNSSYKRDVLVRHDADLERLLAAEWVFHGVLRAEGERIFLEPAAVVEHVNFGLLRPFASATVRAARIGAAARASDWPRAKRLAYALGSPLIPLVRLRRIARPGARALPMLLLGLALDAAGQAAGFARPLPPHAQHDLLDLELERVRFAAP